MTLQEVRFLTIYLAKINARDISTRVVRFPMADFQKIMELGPMRINYLMDVTDSLLRKIVNIPSEAGGYKAFQIFKRCRVDKDENGEWFVEIDAHDDALPLMFDFKERYFTYELWNALRLRSLNQLRMYELMKQYEKLGERTLVLDDLKELLGLDKTDYSRYNNFRADVIEVCQKALAQFTDIKFIFEPVRKKGRGGKIHALKFKISRNDDYEDPLSLSDFIDIKRLSACRQTGRLRNLEKFTMMTS
jgi:plasmid replication initiation protein